MCQVISTKSWYKFKIRTGEHLLKFTKKKIENKDNISFQLLQRLGESGLSVCSNDSTFSPLPLIRPDSVQDLDMGRGTDKTAKDLISLDKSAPYKLAFQYTTETEQMYHHQQQQQVQSHSQHLSSSSRTSLTPEKQFLQQGGENSGLILSTDAKPRLKWTLELHERFVEAVNRLGGPDKATPKSIMRLIGIPGLTMYHLKSHLQKYRLSKNLQAQANAARTQNVLGCMIETEKTCEGNGSPASHLSVETQSSKSMHISEALQMQIEVQRRLHEQLEVQRHLQLRIEAQGKYLQSVLEKAQDALTKQNVAGTFGLELAAKTHTQNEHSVYQHLCDGSVDSCLTSHSQRGGGDQDILSIGLPFEHYLFLDKPSRSCRDSSDERREITLEASELDLSINGGSSRSRSHEIKIDLNGSG